MVTYVVFGWLFCAVVTVFIAHVKNLTKRKWALIAFALGPIAVIAASFTANRPAPDWGEDITNGSGSSADGVLRGGLGRFFGGL